MTDYSLQQGFQESAYERTDVYRASPHLRHRRTYELLLGTLRAAMDDAVSRGLARSMVEIGAGAGGFVEPALAYGWSVTATDMARPAVAMLRSRYGGNAAFTPAFDPGGDLAALNDRCYSLALFASVLHHIPDYVAAVETTLCHIEPGGAFVSVQDPMWYPTQSRAVRLASEAAYLSWRLTHRGAYLSGLRSRLRRATGGLSEAHAEDMVEYHVVRQGVNQHRLIERFGPRFERFAVVPYWSTHGMVAQAAGERLGLANTFGLVGTGYLSSKR